jgi:iron complex transport system ATP-binding protein
LINLKNLTARRGDFHIEIDTLRTAPGELVAVLGNNGSGKSTFLAALSGFLKYRGRYALCDAEFTTLTRNEQNKIVGLLPQKTELNMPFDVHYVILTGRFLHTNGYTYSEQDLSATNHIIRHFDIEHLRNRPFNELSGGEKQRVLLARTINQETPVLLLDEPLNGIDLKHQHDTVRHLHDFKKDKTILVVMHDLSLALREFDRFLVFAKGRLIYDVNKAEVDATRLADIFNVDIRFRQQEGRTYVYTAGR